MSSAGKILRTHRRLADLTQRQLGARLGVTDSAVSEWERDTSVPSRTHAVNADDVLAAGGAVLSAFGYQAAAAPDTSDLAAMRNDITRLDRLVRQLALRVEQLTGEVLETETSVEPTRADPAPTRRRQ